MAASDRPPAVYFDDKWKLSRKEAAPSRGGRAASPPASASASASASRSRSPSQRRCAFSRRCARLVSEQRARFYIVRRCVTMLLCWREYGD